jgi:hypothetical protein
VGRTPGNVPSVPGFPDVYTPRDIDFLAAYIAPVDVWYVLPIEVFGDRVSCQLFPNSRRRQSRYEKYREAWSLMTDPIK